MHTCSTCLYYGRLVNELDNWPDEDAGSTSPTEVVTNTRLHICELLKHLNKTHPYDHAAIAGAIDDAGDRSMIVRMSLV